MQLSKGVRSEFIVFFVPIVCVLLAIMLSGCAGQDRTEIDGTALADMENSESQEVSSVKTDDAALSSAGSPIINLNSTFLRNDLSGKLCVVEYMGNCVAVVDPNTGVVLGREPVGTNPAALASDGARLYVADSGGGELAVAELGRDDVVERFRVGAQPMALAYDATRGVIYAADYHLNSIRIVDVTLRSLVGTVQLEAQGFESREIPPACCFNALDGTVMEGRKPVSLSLSPDGTTLYCGNIGTYDISVIDLETSRETAQFDGVIGMRDVLVTPDGAHLLVAGAGSELIEVNSLVVEDAATGEVQANVPVGRAVTGVAQSADGSVVVAISSDEGLLVRIDPVTWVPTGYCLLGNGLADVVLSSDDATAYVTDSEHNSVSAVDLASMTVLWTSDGFSDPRFIAIL